MRLGPENAGLPPFVPPSINSSTEKSTIEDLSKKFLQLMEENHFFERDMSTLNCVCFNDDRGVRVRWAITPLDGNEVFFEGICSGAIEDVKNYCLTLQFDVQKKSINDKFETLKSKILAGDEKFIELTEDKADLFNRFNKYPDPKVFESEFNDQFVKMEVLYSDLSLVHYQLNEALPNIQDALPDYKDAVIQLLIQLRINLQKLQEDAKEYLSKLEDIKVTVFFDGKERIRIDTNENKIISEAGLTELERDLDSGELPLPVFQLLLENYPDLREHFIKKHQENYLYLSMKKDVGEKWYKNIDEIIKIRKNITIDELIELQHFNADKFFEQLLDETSIGLSRLIESRQDFLSHLSLSLKGYAEHIEKRISETKQKIEPLKNKWIPPESIIGKSSRYLYYLLPGSQSSIKYTLAEGKILHDNHDTAKYKELIKPLYEEYNELTSLVNQLNKLESIKKLLEVQSPPVKARPPTEIGSPEMKEYIASQPAFERARKEHEAHIKTASEELDKTKESNKQVLDLINKGRPEWDFHYKLMQKLMK